MYGHGTCFWPGCPGGSDVCQLSHVCCCGERVGQAAHKALTRYSSWSSSLRIGCKQRQEQLSPAWAWYHGWRNSTGAALFFSPSEEQSFASLIINNIIEKPIHNSIATQRTSYIGMPAHKDACAHACTRSTSACFHTLVRLCYVHKHKAQTTCSTCTHASNECGLPI